MATLPHILNSLTPKTKEESKLSQDQETYKTYQNIITTLPRERGWDHGHLYCYKGFWYRDFHLKGVMAVRDHFVARPTDVLLATSPKSGTVWLKALVFAALSSLNASNPHECVPFLEIQLYTNDRIPDLDALPPPRLFATHIPYSSLPESVKSSNCRTVYLSRDIRDVFVSLFHFGPVWEHVSEYWKVSLERPDNVLFLKYEEMKRDPVLHLKRLAGFLGRQFSEEEEKEGVVEEILRICSFENLKNLEVNKVGVLETARGGIENRTFFRSGKVGDWAGCLTPENVRRLKRVVEEKVSGSDGLSFFGGSGDQNGLSHSGVCSAS
ncbi:Cytosolic sulfotransferase 15 [Acorus gramineus]|uniref:Sulfotransferase n=1 Tax=Acorus gramineus TaxID=55184 RepID=A0AAV8ZZ65_ACOGR|nr:Cytosolic sulfotransferase 15 [Acorus gramineus]